MSLGQRESDPPRAMRRRFHIAREYTRTAIVRDPDAGRDANGISSLSFRPGRSIPSCPGRNGCSLGECAPGEKHGFFKVEDLTRARARGLSSLPGSAPLGLGGEDGYPLLPGLKASSSGPGSGGAVTRGSSTTKGGEMLGQGYITPVAVPAGSASSVAPPAARRRSGGKQG